MSGQQHDDRTIGARPGGLGKICQSSHGNGCTVFNIKPPLCQLVPRLLNLFLGYAEHGTVGRADRGQDLLASGRLADGNGAGYRRLRGDLCNGLAPFDVGLVDGRAGSCLNSNQVRESLDQVYLLQSAESSMYAQEQAAGAHRQDHCARSSVAQLFPQLVGHGLEAGQKVWTVDVTGIVGAVGGRRPGTGGGIFVRP